MPRTTPPPLSLTLTMLRKAGGWTQRGLAEAVGMDASLLSRYEKGQGRNLSRAKLLELGSAMDYRPEDIDLLLQALGAIRRADGDAGHDPERAASRHAQRTALRLGLAVAQLAEAHLLERARTHRRRRQRRLAARLWSRLEDCAPAERRLLVAKAREFQSWSLCERLCDESERSAAHDATEAREQAELAVRVAELAPGDEARRSRYLGYARAFVANALRVADELREAEAEFGRAWELWRAGAAAGDVLPEWRLLDREASLRRAFRQWPEALLRLEEARAMAPPEAVGRILLNRAATLDQAGEIEAALATLREAVPLVEAAGDPRL
jgi:transcriptional regulator with XRE-family HTH domain